MNTSDDENSKLIRDRMLDIRCAGRTEFNIDVMRVHGMVGKDGHWLCATHWSPEKSFVGHAAEGKTLKEALGKLADKIANSLDATDV